VTLGAPRAALASGGAKKKAVPGQVIVNLQPGATIDQVASEYGCAVVSETSGSYLMQLDKPGYETSVVKDMRTDPKIAAAGQNAYVSSPNARLRPGRHQTQTFPFDEAGNLTVDRAGYDAQPLVTALHLDQMPAGFKGQGVVVAIIDTGVDLTHPDLAGHFATDESGNVIGADFVDGGLPNDDPAPQGKENGAWGHGTFIAGLIRKVAPEARIMPIRALGPDGIGTTYNVVQAIDFAVRNAGTAPR
jgi:subtilisin family serine protease